MIRQAGGPFLRTSAQSFHKTKKDAASFDTASLGRGRRFTQAALLKKRRRRIFALSLATGPQLFETFCTPLPKDFIKQKRCSIFRHCISWQGQKVSNCIKITLIRKCLLNYDRITTWILDIQRLPGCCRRFALRFTDLCIDALHAAGVFPAKDGADGAGVDAAFVA